MKNTTTITREKSAAIDNVSADIGKAGVYTIAIAAGVIGCWATLCIVAGTISSGGPVELVSNLFKAITG